MNLVATVNRDVIVSLYLSGLNAREISEKLHVGQASIYYALRKEGVQRRRISDSNNLLFEKRLRTFKIVENRSYEEEQLRIAGILLYWAEGYKVGRKNVIDFANSDPHMARLFVKFLREVCTIQEDKLRCSLYCYEGQDIEALTLFWSEFFEGAAFKVYKAIYKGVQSK